MLSPLIWAPFLGVVLIGLYPQPLLPSRARQLALAIATLTLFWSIYVAT